ncbi:hypothetical protein CsSME_00012784 [Camellia sinensis var. sinensis]
MRKLPKSVNEEEASLFDILCLLLASVIFVPRFQKISGGSPVLGYLTAGILIGPYGLYYSIHQTVKLDSLTQLFAMTFDLLITKRKAKHFVFILLLSVERLSSMKKYVFGLGSAQVLVTAVVIGLVSRFIAGQPSPAAIVIGNGLALSSTAVVLQVLQERGESTSRHERATFSVLLFQLFRCYSLRHTFKMLELAEIKIMIAATARIVVSASAIASSVVAVGNFSIIFSHSYANFQLLWPIYKQVEENQNNEIFSANTLLVILGTSLLTAWAGLSMALGAFFAGSLLAEMEFLYRLNQILLHIVALYWVSQW